MAGTQGNVATVTVGDGVVVVRRTQGSRFASADILHLEQDAQGVLRRIVVDRVIHEAGETVLGDYTVSGAFVSVLARRPPA